MKTVAMSREQRRLVETMRTTVGEYGDVLRARDSYAGGMLGYLASKDTYDVATLKNAIAAGTVMASFTIEDFSLNRLASVTAAEIQQRRKVVLQIVGSHIRQRLIEIEINRRAGRVLNRGRAGIGPRLRRVHSADAEL